MNTPPPKKKTQQVVIKLDYLIDSSILFLRNYEILIL